MPAGLCYEHAVYRPYIVTLFTAQVINPMYKIVSQLASIFGDRLCYDLMGFGMYSNNYSMAYSISYCIFITMNILLFIAQRLPSEGIQCILYYSSVGVQSIVSLLVSCFL